jgi:hypothetical protein
MTWHSCMVRECALVGYRNIGVVDFCCNNIIFFRLTGHYVKYITLFNQNIASYYHIIAIRVI